MKSIATLQNLYTSLSLNSSATNAALGLQLMSDEHRRTLLKYFDNEKTYQTSTVGAMTLATTANMAGGATSATLTGSWIYPTGTQVVTFTNSSGTTATLTANAASGAVSGTLSSNWTGPTGLQSITFGNTNSDKRDVQFTNGSTAITWTVPLTSATTSKTITTNATSEIHDVTFVNGSTGITFATGLYYGISNTTITTQGFQKYQIPANISKIINDTITVGQLRFQPSSIESRQDWDMLNTLPYTSDIPNQFFIYNGNVEFWPIPSTTGNLITFNYKTRVPDFSTAFMFSDTSGTAYVAGSKAFDYQVGSLSGLAAGITAITGSGTAWNATGKFPLNTDLSFYNLFLVIPQPSGDGFFYPITKFTSDTALVLKTPLQNAPSSTTAANGYAIAQLPLLTEDFHDMIVNGALVTYWSSPGGDPGRVAQYEKLYKEKKDLLEDYAGTKSVNVDLGGELQYRNPNLYPYAPAGS